MLNPMEKLIAEYGMLPRGTRVLCALSGGADSMCLLHSLCRLRDKLCIEVMAAHYNHTLRGAESDRDETFVREQCAQLQVVLIVGRGEVAAAAKQTGRGLEETAREMRYSFLQQTAQEVGAQVVATAHNANDNAETVLMHLIRGTGLRGLTGIAPVRGNIIRPLLTTTRVEIEAYLAAQGISFVEDSTNADEAYTRNRIRHSVLPLLEDICPGTLERLNQTAETLRKDEEYLTGQAEMLACHARGTGEMLSIPAQVIAQAHEAAAVRAVRILIGRLRTGNDNCTTAHLHGVLAAARSADPSARTFLPGGLTVRREYEKLVFTTREPQPLTGPVPLNLPGVTWTGAYRLECREVVYCGQAQQPFCLYLDKARVEAVCLRSRQVGDRLTRPDRPGKTVKKLLIDEKIPLQNREELPVFEVLGQVAAVAGLGPDASFVPRPGERAWQIVITPDNEREMCGGKC